MPVDEPFLCPTCRKPVTPDAKTFPFCSDRCRMVDLGHWLKEDYRISRPLPSDKPAKEISPDDEEGDGGSGGAENGDHD